jgi:ankyrin repeat protein
VTSVSHGQQKLGEEVGNELIEASKAGDCAKVATLLSSQDAESFINYQNEDGFTPVHCSTVNDQLTVTKLLIEVRCNVNVTSRFGRTPMMTVAQNGITAIAKQLIEARCNVELQQYDGATPLYMAAFFGHPDVTEQLIEAHVNIDLEHENGYTPLMIPAYRGHAAAIIGTVGIERLRG